MTSDRKTKVLHDKILDSKFGEHSINKFSDEAKKNDDREIDLVDFDFKKSGLEKYEAAGNYSKLFEILKTYSENNDDKAFLVVENKSTGNFLQFAKEEKTNFLLDIPMIGLNETEKIRAQRFLRRITEKENGENIFDINRGFPAEENGMFMMLLPDNIDTVTKIVIGFFVEVYLLPPKFKFKISKGSF